MNEALHINGIRHVPARDSGDQYWLAVKARSASRSQTCAMVVVGGGQKPIGDSLSIYIVT